MAKVSEPLWLSLRLLMKGQRGEPAGPKAVGLLSLLAY
jgi:hypothetical protein